MDDVRRIIRAGADKISLNSSAVKCPKLALKWRKNLARNVVLILIQNSMDMNGRFMSKEGEKKQAERQGMAKQVVELGAGEILLTSMNNDGTKNGFALEITQAICEAVNVPIIAQEGQVRNRILRSYLGRQCNSWT